MRLGAREQLKRLILVCVTAVLLTGWMAQFTSVATAQPLTVGGATSGGSSMVAKCEDYPGISNRIVKCVRTTLTNAGDKFFTAFYPMISRTVIGFITLSVIIYGVMMAAGMVEKIGRDSMVLLIKIAFVSYFVQNVDMLYDWILSAMDSLSASIFTFATVNHPTAPVCMEGKSTVWERLDCLADTMFGLKYDEGGSEATSNVRIGGQGLARGLFAFFGSALISSVPGFIIGIIGFMFMYTMLFFIVKVVFTYLMAYMGLMFLMIIGPLFMPLVIFRTTKQYFDNWVRLVISCALQPIIIIAFVSFAVAAIDVAVFSGDKSFVRTIAGDAAKQNGFNLNEYIESKGGYVKRKVGPTVVAETTRDEAEGSTARTTPWGTVMENDCGLDLDTAESMGESAQECAQGWVVGLNLNSIDWAKLAEERSPEVEQGDAKDKEEALMNELYASGILTAVMVFIMNALMKVVPQIANDLIGSYRQTPNLFGAAGGWKWQQQGGGMASGMAAQMRQGMNRGTP